MRLTEVRIAGFGGQGVILSAIVIGKAASIYQSAFATMTQNFGPEARGGACSAQLILSDAPILYPYVTQPDIMADLLDRGVQSVVKINECVLRPNCSPQLLSRNEFTGMFEQDLQHLKRLLLQMNENTVLAKFSRT